LCDVLRRLSSCLSSRGGRVEFRSGEAGARDPRFSLESGRNSRPPAIDPNRPYRRRALPNSAHRSARTLPDAQPHDRTYRPSRSSRPARSKVLARRLQISLTNPLRQYAPLSAPCSAEVTSTFRSQASGRQDSLPDRQATLGRAARAARHAPEGRACIPTDTSASSRDRAQSVRHRSRRYYRVKQHFWTRVVRTCLETRWTCSGLPFGWKGASHGRNPRAMRQSSNASRTGVS